MAKFLICQPNQVVALKMKTETITVTNKNGTEITLTFDANNLLVNNREIGLRIPAKFGAQTSVILIHSHKTNYLTDVSFLTRVEQFGKPQIIELLRQSGDSVIIPPPDTTHFWSIVFESSEEN